MNNETILAILMNDEEKLRNLRSRQEFAWVLSNEITQKYFGRDIDKIPDWELRYLYKQYDLKSQMIHEYINQIGSELDRLDQSFYFLFDEIKYVKKEGDK